MLHGQHTFGFFVHFLNKEKLFNACNLFKGFMVVFLCAVSHCVKTALADLETCHIDLVLDYGLNWTLWLFAFCFYPSHYLHVTGSFSRSCLEYSLGTFQTQVSLFYGPLRPIQCTQVIPISGIVRWQTPIGCAELGHSCHHFFYLMHFFLYYFVDTCFYLYIFCQKRQIFWPCLFYYINQFINLLGESVAWT